MSTIEKKVSKIDWEPCTSGVHTGTDGFGVVVSAKQATSWDGGQRLDQHLLHIDLMVFLGEPVADPRPAIEAAIKTLREELGMEP